MILHLLIIQVVTFIVLLVVLRQIFYKQLNESLLRLQTLHKLNLARENELKERIEAVNRERDEKLALARAEADRIIKEAAFSSAKLTSDMEASAEVKIAEALAQVRVEFERREQALWASHRQDVLNAAVKLVAAVFSVKAMNVLHAQCVDEALDELAGLDQAMFTSCGTAITVSSPAALDEVRKEQIRRILLEKTGHEVQIEFHEAADLVAGIGIYAGSLTIDGTLRNKLNRVLEHLQRIS